MVERASAPDPGTARRRPRRASEGLVWLVLLAATGLLLGACDLGPERTPAHDGPTHLSADDPGGVHEAQATVPADEGPPASPPEPAGSLGPTNGDGSVSVIVELAVPVAPESDLDPGQIGQQRDDIARTTSEVVDDLGPHASVNREYTTLPYVALDLDPAQIAGLGRRPDVAAVHPDDLSAPTLGQSIPWVGADLAHGAGIGGAGSVVAVLDTGVSSSHPMLAGKVVAQACFARGQNSTDAVGDCPNGLPSQTGGSSGEPCGRLDLSCGHGTHVASTAAGSPVNVGGSTLVGVAPEADVIAIQVYSYFVGSDSCGTPSECIRSYASDQLAALDHVNALSSSYEIAAVNLSLGGSKYTDPCDTDSRAAAIGTLRAAGIATVIASGNDGYKDGVNRPGCISDALTVGATGDSSDIVPGFSNSAAMIDLLAPGQSIHAAYPGGLYSTSSGTSMATPHVAGAVAILHGLDPDLTVDELESTLETSGVSVTDTNGITRPRVDVAAAISATIGPNWQEATGQLRVTTTPAVPGQIIVDGTPRDSWGLNWPDLAVGNHEVCFGPVPGYTPPPCQNVEVLEDQVTTVDGGYAQRGTLRVLTSPAVPSTITIDGAPANDWGVWTDLDPGIYEICFGAVADLDPPACEDAVIAPGATETITGTFTEDLGAPGPSGHGYLRATTDPAVASRISIDGNVADSWGLTWLKLPPGDHEICFESVMGATAPACEQVVITADQTTEVTGSFEAHGILRVLTSPAVPSTITIDGEPANAWGLWTSLEPGTYVVCFGFVAGHSTPACQDAVVTAGLTTEVTGTFT